MSRIDPTTACTMLAVISCAISAAPANAQLTCSSPGAIGVGTNQLTTSALNTGIQSFSVPSLALTGVPSVITIHKVGWYRFVPPASGWYQFSACGSINGGWVALLGSCPVAGAPQPLAIDACGFGPSIGRAPLVQQLRAGVPYLFCLGTSSATAQPVSGTLTISQASAPPTSNLCELSSPAVRDFTAVSRWDIDNLPPARPTRVMAADFGAFSAGALVGQRGWLQFGTSSAAALQVSQGAVTIPGGASIDGQDAFLPLPRQFSAPTSASTQEVVLNFDLVLRVNSAGANPSHFAALNGLSTGATSGNPANARLAARSSGSGFVLGTRVNGEDGYPYAFGTQVLAYGQDYAVRAEVHLVAGSANDFIRLYVGSDFSSLGLHATAAYSGAGTVNEIAVGAMLLSQNGVGSSQPGVSIRSMSVSVDGGARIGIVLAAVTSESQPNVDCEVLVDGQSAGWLRRLGGYCLVDRDDGTPPGTGAPPATFFDIPSALYNAAIADRRLSLSLSMPTLGSCGNTACCPSYPRYNWLGVTVWPRYADCNGNGTSDACETSPGGCVLVARADLTGDGVVDGDDLGLLLGAWGPCPGDCPADINRNGTVDGDDLGLLLGSWGFSV